MNTFAPFKSRSEALRLFNALKEKKIAATIIDTPRRAGLSCGLSVVFDKNYRSIVQNIVLNNRLNSFLGFFDK